MTMDGTGKPARLLVLAASPAQKAGLALGKEARAIKTSIREAPDGESLEVRVEWAVRPADVLVLLQEYRPHIVHFCGHGDDDQRLLLEDDDGHGKPVDADDLARMFRAVKHDVGLVVFNICHSFALAETLAGEIDSAIGVDGAWLDQAAVVFAGSLYRAIASGYSVAIAVEQAVAVVQTEGVSLGPVPALLGAGQNHRLLGAGHARPLQQSTVENDLSGLRAVPDAPPHYLPREDAIAAVERALLGGAGKVGISAVGDRRDRLGVYGLGGIGKSVLAAAVVRNLAVRENFPDGVLWLTVGQEPELTTLQAQLARALGVNEVFASSGEGHRRLRELFADRAVLLVLDDVWELSHAGKLDVVGTRGRLLMTTRNREILISLGAEEFCLDILTMDQALHLLADWTGCEPAVLPAEAARVAELCGCLPLALAMIGAMVREGAMWADALESLERADIADIAHRIHDYPYDDVLRAMEVSIHALTDELRDLYIDLAVFAEDEKIPESALAVLWNMRDGQVRATLRKLAARSLLQQGDAGQVHLHDLQRMYVRARAGDLAARHGALVDAYVARCKHGLARGPGEENDPPDQYFFTRLPYHLLATGREAELYELLCQYDWLYAKLCAVGAAELAADFVRFAGNDDMGLVRDALRLSTHVITRDVNQLPSQLVGRLGGYIDRPVIAALLDGARAETRFAWLCPLIPSLAEPGGLLVCTLEGHSGSVTAVAVTPDGKRAVSASKDKTVKIWDLETGAEMRSLTGHTGEVWAVAVTPDGKRAVSVSQDNILKIWDIKTGAELCSLRGHSSSVRAVAVALDGRRAVSASEDKTLKIWDLETGAELRSLTGHWAPVHEVVVTPDGRRAVSASEDRNLKVWDLETGAELPSLIGHSDVVWAVAVTPDGKRAVSASEDKTLKIWDLRICAELRTLRGHSDVVWAVAVTPDGRRAVSASRNNILKIWDLETGTELRSLRGHLGSVTAVAVTPDGRRAVSASMDETLKVWNLETDAEQRFLLTGHWAPVDEVAVTPDGKRAVSASQDKTVKIWDLETGAELCSLTGHTGEVWAVAVTPDGRRAVSVSEDKTLKIWDLDNSAELRSFTGHWASVNEVAVTPDGRRAVSASEDNNSLKILDLETGAELRRFTGHTGEVWAVAVTPDGRRAVFASSGGHLKVKLWDMETGVEMDSLHVFFSPNELKRSRFNRTLLFVRVTQDGRRAVSGYRDKTLRVWDLETGAELRSLRMHNHLQRRDWAKVVVAPDTAYVVSTSRDKTLKIWDLQTGRQCFLAEYSGRDLTRIDLTGSKVFAATPDGRHVVSASEHQTLKVWDLATYELIATFTGEGIMKTCAVYGRDIVLVDDQFGCRHFLRLVTGNPLLRNHDGGNSSGSRLIIGPLNPAPGEILDILLSINRHI